QNLGGTAIGTGFNAPRDYIMAVTEELRKLSGLSINRAENLIDATQNIDSIAEVSGMLKCLAVNLMKISEDLRFLSSGPDGGIGELVLPAVQEGSSIMPGKVNPVIPEYVIQIAIQAMANDNSIAMAAGRGCLELNQFLPLISTLLLDNFRLLERAVKALDVNCVRGIKLNLNRINGNLESSMAIFTYLSAYIGHDKAAALYAESRQKNISPKKAVVDSGIMSENEYDNLMKPEKFRTLGFIHGSKKSVTEKTGQ
ncbi:MAG TPA: lyase family protein, partial [Candidatus Goldiibacteriota bacterium]|nr:lyase family protein [Candidatus Goldiibacteriota bacterium]